ncbi:MAG: pantoate--beta-alanine ligase [bacterium (Candidatus Ratteibacteria) CG_4_10_14_3_um_filter_41_18]|uniref:Pantothenate synthetase n=4 Tax=Candidatus Ratteibacteria TaxID=2979319 RepID=A0A2M7YH88_9BACT|nr:MAG: pantoate--beta-alanine ligase [bacterium (Candidatus Ratteibacteria) CG01_land_8_20_14_3_00_40_19]PIW34204.1 MAG: pantoate--beta-alanine ligase [bacterium (Candidatus Ratteibacteria) CG15_BIG_FIL_POST_REV_8_21_14_020_41_12]PIW73832.1 MAG: pantoate--beta-alanine ligase [bacterium (Candidatus Ratteibacteria) CG_4_8_14_3_um_filter_41_36]PIX77787.1 MAG: pantoate--beta-alanine ligase [bacterium (Candidatus Ratteibacteria) CG_4_10_14_3_um_filter_41_18]PJA62337.1 MAG: pantoate--beta-alanine li
MKVIKKSKELQTLIEREKKKGKIIGLVPTMGYLHSGHISLIKRAKKDCGIVVVSIYVNPTQFGPGEDYQRYPRDLERDKKLAKEAGTDILFVPSDEEIYPDSFHTYIQVEELSGRLCGVSRPIHFRGVATIVAKLFNIVKPTKAYFGWKDAQQLIILKKMVKDLNMDVEVVGLPTVREKDGLAISSRNKYLSKQERKIAPILYQALVKAKKMVNSGENNSARVLQQAKDLIKKKKGVKIDYLKAINLIDLKDAKKIKKNTLIAIAAWIGKTRLIDNVII